MTQRNASKPWWACLCSSPERVGGHGFSTWQMSVRQVKTNRAYFPLPECRAGNHGALLGGQNRPRGKTGIDPKNPSRMK